MQPKNKVKIELNPDVIAKIDVLIDEGLYPDYASFIDRALTTQLQLHNSTLEKIENKISGAVGFVIYDAKFLEKVAAEGKKLNIKVIGGLKITSDVSPELANQTIKKIQLAGIFRAPKDVKAILLPKRLTITGKRYKSQQFLSETVDEGKEED